jgi:hypothetical protein
MRLCSARASQTEACSSPVTRGRVPPDLLAAKTAQFTRRRAVLSEEPVHLVRRGVRRSVGVQEQDLPSHASKHQSGVETGRAGADDCYVESAGFVGRVHALRDRKLGVSLEALPE